MSTVQKSYAGAVNHPSKEQAIILDAIENVSQDEYAREIGNLIGPKQVRFSSKVSKNRICIYVATKDIAKELIEKHKYITIAGKPLEIRPLNANKRVIISNVHPYIPHEEIEKQLVEDFNIKLE